MKKIVIFLTMMLITMTLYAQSEPEAGAWKPWFIKSGKEWRLQKPTHTKEELIAVLSKQQTLDSASVKNIQFWNAGSTGYRWQQLIATLWMNDVTYNGALSNMLMSTAIYDATIAAWETKYAYKLPRPFEVDKRVQRLAPNPENPSYPCEVSVAAGAAATIIGHFYPKMADSVHRMAENAMISRITAGVAFPIDTKAGFELGKKIALHLIEQTKTYPPQTVWDGKIPQKPGLWNGKFAMLPLAGLSKTVVLDSASQFRPPPPPDFAKEMDELRKFKPNFSSTANAFYFATQSFWDEVLHKKIFEYNLHTNAPRAAQYYAASAVGMYDGFASCWDAKYTYWGIRPDQYDTTFRPVLFFTPPFPGYPSGHAMLGSVMAGLYSYFFPSEAKYFEKKAQEAAESRFQGGIHFRTDNEVALVMGKKVAAVLVQKIRLDRANEPVSLTPKATTQRKTALQKELKSLNR